MDGLRPLLTEQEAADYFNISKRKMAYLHSSGHLRAVYIGRCKRYTMADLDEYIDRMKTEGRCFQEPLKVELPVVERGRKPHSLMPKR